MQKKNHVLIISNSDFGKRSTMGYRAYQIKKNADNISSISRSNSIQIDGAKEIGRLFLLFSRSLQLLLKITGKNRFYDFLRDKELKIFRSWAKIYIRKDEFEIIHFFIQDRELFEYAKKFGKVVFTEAFTHPFLLKKLSDTYELEFNYSIGENFGIIESYRIADAIISPSDWVTHSLYFDKSLERNKIFNVHYGVDLLANNSVGEKPKEEKLIKLLFVGGLKPSKGIGDLINAFELLDQELYELHLYGRRFSLPDDLDMKINNNQNIIYHGFSMSLSQIYADKQIYILPSYHEGSSKTIFEAMSFGIPVICTPNSGSIIRDKENGMIIPVNSPSKIAESIIELTSDKNLYNSIKERALSEIREYTWEDYASKVLSIYEKF